MKYWVIIRRPQEGDLAYVSHDMIEQWFKEEIPLQFLYEIASKNGWDVEMTPNVAGAKREVPWKYEVFWERWGDEVEEHYYGNARWLSLKIT